MICHVYSSNNNPPFPLFYQIRAVKKSSQLTLIQYLYYLNNKSKDIAIKHKPNALT